MAQFQVTALTAMVEARIRDMLDRAENMQPAFAAIGRVLKMRIDLCFKLGRSPWGEPWLPLKYRRGQPLIDTGRLRRSVAPKAAPDYVTIGTNLVQAKLQNFGGKVSQEARTVQLQFRRERDGTIGNRFVPRNRTNFLQQATIGARSFTVPARPYMPIRPYDQIDLPQDWAVAILRELADHLRIPVPA